MQGTTPAAASLAQRDATCKAAVARSMEALEAAPQAPGHSGRPGACRRAEPKGRTLQRAGGA